MYMGVLVNWLYMISVEFYFNFFLPFSPSFSAPVCKATLQKIMAEFVVQAKPSTRFGHNYIDGQNHRIHKLCQKSSEYFSSY